MKISVKFSGDHSDQHGNLDSGLFTTTLPVDYIAKSAARNIINEQILPHMFENYVITASGFGRSEGGWSFDIAPPSADFKKLIEQLNVGDEWTDIEIEVEAPDDFSV